MHVVSASRRTDLPAFYWRWFMSRIEAGDCLVANPFRPSRMRKVSLAPENVVAIVFWTRNAVPMLADINRLEEKGYTFYVQYTITGYPRELEPRVPPLGAATDTLRRLSERIGPDRVIWRYDPIILSSATPLEYHIERFSTLARELAGAVESATVSFCDEYAKTQRAFARLSESCGWRFRDGNQEERISLLSALAGIAAHNGIGLATCAETSLDAAGVRLGQCVDPVLLARLRPDLDLQLRAGPTRSGCGCVQSVDIGAYDTCPFGCVYCYANRSLALAQHRHATHDPKDVFLGGRG